MVQRSGHSAPLLPLAERRLLARVKAERFQQETGSSRSQCSEPISSPSLHILPAFAFTYPAVPQGNNFSIVPEALAGALWRSNVHGLIFFKCAQHLTLPLTSPGRAGCPALQTSRPLALPGFFQMTVLMVAWDTPHSNFCCWIYF